MLKLLGITIGLWLLGMGLSLDMAWPAVVGLVILLGTLATIVSEPRWHEF